MILLARAEYNKRNVASKYLALLTTTLAPLCRLLSVTSKCLPSNHGLDSQKPPLVGLAFSYDRNALKYSAVQRCGEERKVRELLRSVFCAMFRIPTNSQEMASSIRNPEFLVIVCLFPSLFADASFLPTKCQPFPSSNF